MPISIPAKRNSPDASKLILIERVICAPLFPFEQTSLLQALTGRAA
jgi:hypothetical protein